MEQILFIMFISDELLVTFYTYHYCNCSEVITV